MMANEKELNSNKEQARNLYFGETCKRNTYV